MPDPIIKAQHDEPMRAAIIRAKRTFKYFWRELSWESRRIIPGLETSAIKIPIKTEKKGDGIPEFEHMWFNNIEFDGSIVSGELLNEPSWTSAIKPGDRSGFKIEEISDWLYAINGRAYGGFTVNAMRLTMDTRSKASHDRAWGLDFGDPRRILIVPTNNKKGLFGLFKGKDGYEDGDDIPEHPMSLNMAEKCEEGIRENPEPFIKINDDGSSMLHFDASAGNLTQVKILLKYGADKNLKDKNGFKPIDLAKKLQWPKVVDALS